MLIVGAGEAGAWAINVCKSNKTYGRPVVVADDAPEKLNQTIHGVPVKGTLEDIPELCTPLQHLWHHHCHPDAAGQPAEPCD